MLAPLRHLRVPGIVLALTTLLPVAPALAQPASESATAWQVVEERVIDVDGAPITLSPDGNWIAGTGPDRESFCVWDVATLDATCDGDERFGTVVPRSVTWAPDSSAVAFSLDAPRLLIDSDVYVFELETGEIVNLTEDDPEGIGADDTGFSSDNDTPVPIDLYPSWSPDSQQLVFARTMWGFGLDIMSGTTLMTIPREGGEPEELLVLAPPSPMIVSGPMVWQEDDSIIFAIWKADRDDGQNGIWRTSLSGGLKRVLAGDADSDVPTPLLGDVSADGIGASVMSAVNYGRLDSGNVYFAVDIPSGEAMPWEGLLGLDATPDAALSPGGSGLLYAPPVYSPDDRSVGFLVRGPEGTVTLSISSEPGVSEPILTYREDERPAYPPSLAEPRIDWVTEDTMLVITHLGVSVLTIQHGGDAPATPCACTPPRR